MDGLGREYSEGSLDTAKEHTEDILMKLDQTLGMPPAGTVNLKHQL